MHDGSPVFCSFAKDPGISFQALGLRVFGGSRFRHLAFFGLRCDFGLLSCRLSRCQAIVHPPMTHAEQQSQTMAPKPDEYLEVCR